MKNDLINKQADATDSIIKQMVQRIVQEFEPEKVILIGSHASGEAGPDSDIDLVIIKSEPFGPGRSRRQEMTRIWKVLAKFAVPKDILLYSREEAELWRESKNHILASALREGSVLYERS